MVWKSENKEIMKNESKTYNVKGIRSETGLDEVVDALMRGQTVGVAYKRRKFTNRGWRSEHMEDGPLPVNEMTEDTWVNDGRVVLNIPENANVPRTEDNVAVNVSDRASVQYWQIVMAEKMCKFDETDLPLSCLNDCAFSHSDWNPSNKGSVKLKKRKHKSILQNGDPHSNSQNSDTIYVGDDVSNGVLVDDYPHTVLPFRNAFLRIIMSKKFFLFCKLLLENFKGIEVDDFFDFNLINSRMKDGSYQRAPILFASDLQQVWGRIQNIGHEMLSISQSLSELSSVFCSDVLGELECEEQVKKLDKYWCNKCGEKAEGKECIVCDSCEVAFHISCVSPPLLHLHSRAWYCPTCIGNARPPSSAG